MRNQSRQWLIMDSKPSYTNI